MLPYKNLENHFTKPKILNPFYGNIRIPRKVKKKVKKYCGIHWKGFTNGQRLWYYMEHKNNDYKRFLIKLICKNQTMNKK